MGELNDLFVLCLSDLHFSKDYCPCDGEIASIVGIVNNSGCSNVLISVSGDLVNTGSAKEYDSVSCFLDLVKEEIRSDLNVHFVIAPGNHDYCYSSNPCFPLSEALSVNYSNFEEKEKERMLGFSNFNCFKNKFCSKNLKKHNDLVDETIISLGGKLLSVFSLNDCVFCTCNDPINGSNLRKSNSDSGNVFIPKEFFDSIKNCNSDYSFIVMHIPPEFFDDDTRESFLQAIKEKVSLIFCGHLHKELQIAAKTSPCDDIQILECPSFEKDGLCDGGFLSLNFRKETKTHYVSSNQMFVNADEEKGFTVKEIGINKMGLVIDDDFKQQITEILSLDTKLLLKDIFVFPQLSEKPFSKSTRTGGFILSCFEDFESRRTKNTFLFIFGESKYGKTTLCNYLFLKYHELGFFPVIIDGDFLKKPSSVKGGIKSAIDNEYSTKTAIDQFRQIDKSKIILLIDDGKFLDTNTLDELNGYTDSVVVFSEPTSDLYNNIQDKCISSSNQKLFFEPMYLRKRKELLANIYESRPKQSKIDLGLTKDQFIEKVETTLSQLDKFDEIDPGTISFFAVQVFKGDLSFNSGLFSSVYEAKLDISLQNGITHSHLSFNHLVVKRILGALALSLFEKHLSFFSSDEMNEYIEKENIEYGNSGIKNKTFLGLLIDIKFLQLNEDQKYSFISREMFAYFIAYESVRRAGCSDGDTSLIQKMLSNDIFVPLNFLVIMSISMMLKSERIIVSLSDFLVKSCMNIKTIDEKELLSFVISKEEIKKLKSLSKDDVKRIEDKKSNDERNNRQHYLEHKSDFYYFDAVSKDMHDIQQFVNTLRIANVILDKFSSQLPVAKKEELIECVIKLPNIIITKFHDSLFKELDELFVDFKKNNPSKTKDENFVELTNALIDIKRAFILMSYSLGSYGFTDNSVIKLLQSHLADESNKKQTIKVQELMLLSYSRQTDLFISETKKCISKQSKDTPFVKSSAFIIARNYCIRNHDDVTKNHRDLWEIVVQKERTALTTVYKK